MDARLSGALGSGYSHQYRSYMETGSFATTLSFLALTDKTSLDVTLSESRMVTPRSWSSHAGLRHRDRLLQGFRGIDTGVGVTRVGPQKVGLSLSVMGGPRWSNATLRNGGVTPNGMGVRVRGEMYFRYTRLEDTRPRPSDEDWFQRYLLGSMHVWAEARYDVVELRAGPSWSGGIGVDLARAVMLPIFDAIDRR